MSALMSHTCARLSWAIVLALLVSPPVAAQYQARVTQVDRSAFPNITVYVSITDEQNNPIALRQPLTLELYEGNEQVLKAELSDEKTRAAPKPVSVVLVLDRSGSMSGEKVVKAREAASTFVRLAPAHYEIGLVQFDNRVERLVELTADRPRLLQAIAALTPVGGTALQDGIGQGLAMLKGRPGRRTVIALTDGLENSSTLWGGTDGKRRLLDEAAQADCSISVIGLGVDVHQAYLQDFQRTGGFYLFSPDEGALRGRFEQLSEVLREEWHFEYTSPGGAADGRRRAVTVRLLVDGREVAISSARYVSPGLVPNVRGAHRPYFLALLGLVLAPGLLAGWQRFAGVRRFRSTCVTRLELGMVNVGKRDPNGGQLAVGDLVVLCPSCSVHHLVRSWRLNRCQCMRDGNGKGRYCYASILPAWLRRCLDRLMGGRSGEGGRSWLCRCAGDRDGY